MKRWIVSGCLFFLVAAVGFAAAESPFVGAWKLNQQKSHLTGSTLKFSSAGHGVVRETVAEGTYTFKTDGQSYPALFGETENWKKLSGHSWQTIEHDHGYTYTDALTVSNDGHTLTVTTTGTSPDGSALHVTQVYKRIAGGAGLMGTWKTTAIKTRSSRVEEFAANGGRGLIWKAPQIKARIDIKFDGRDYAPQGPTIPQGFTLAFKKRGPRSFHLIEKMHGKPIYSGTFTVLADGKTLTLVGRPTGQAQMETSVYDKQ